METPTMQAEYINGVRFGSIIFNHTELLTRETIGDKQCVGCTLKVRNNERIKFKLGCGHFYHLDCLRKIIEERGLNCALCGDLDECDNYYCPICMTWRAHSWDKCSRLIGIPQA